MQRQELEKAQADKAALSQQLSLKVSAHVPESSSGSDTTQAFEQRVEAEVKERTKGALRKAMQLGQDRVGPTGASRYDSLR